MTSNLRVNDIEKISFVSSVDDSNRKVADSLVNDSQKINVDHNTIKIPPLARTKVQKHLNETTRFSCSKSHKLSILKFRSPHISEPSDHLANLTRALLK